MFAYVIRYHFFTLQLGWKQEKFNVRVASRLKQA
jgi:hypothetical protein